MKNLLCLFHSLPLTILAHFPFALSDIKWLFFPQRPKCDMKSSSLIRRDFTHRKQDENELFPLSIYFNNFLSYSAFLTAQERHTTRNVNASKSCSLSNDFCLFQDFFLEPFFLPANFSSLTSGKLFFTPLCVAYSHFLYCNIHSFTYTCTK